MGAIIMKTISVFGIAMSIFAVSETVLGDFAWLGDLGGFGLLGWYLWWTTTKTIPQLNAQNNARQKEIIDDFRADLASHAEACSTERKYYVDMLNKLIGEKKV